VAALLPASAGAQVRLAMRREMVLLSAIGLGRLAGLAAGREVLERNS
jgi:hypothetical protein